MEVAIGGTPPTLNQGTKGEGKVVMAAVAGGYGTKSGHGFPTMAKIRVSQTPNN